MNRGHIDAAARSAVIAAMAVVQIAWLIQPISIWLKIFHVALVGLALVRPTEALLVFFGLAWVSTGISKLAGSPYPGSKLLEQMVLATVTGALTRRGRSGTRLAAPMLLFATVAAGSAIAVLPARIAVASPGATFGTLLTDLFSRGEYFERPPVWEPLYFAMLAIESALLAWAVERTVRHQPEIVDSLLRASLVGSAGAGLLNLTGVVAGALRTTDAWPSFIRILSSVRYSSQTDVNAASSTLLLALLSSLSLLDTSLRKAAMWGVLLALTIVGFWITGSRVAFAGLLIGWLLGAVWFALGQNRRTRQIAVAALVATATCGALFVAYYPRGRNWDLKQSIETRSVLLGVGLTMFRSAPVAGIGIGRFNERSGELVGPDILRLMGGQNHENAHNNFLQTLAEQGLVGLAALLLTLGAVFLGLWRAERAAPDARRRWLCLSLVGCIVTWLTGHPLLVPEFAFIFWMYVAVLAGLTPPPAWPRLRWIVVTVALAVLISAPVRATRELRAANFEHLGFGVSQWEHDAEVPYRRAGRRFSLYVPAQGAMVQIPAQRADGAPDPLTIEMSIDGHLVDVQRVSGNEWQVLSLIVPRGKQEYVLVRFTVANAPPSPPAPVDVGQGQFEGEPPLIRVGKTQVR